MRWLQRRGLRLRFLAYAVALLVVMVFVWLAAREELDSPPVSDFGDVAVVLGKYLCDAHGDIKALSKAARKVRANLHINVAVYDPEGRVLVSSEGMTGEFLRHASLTPLSEAEFDALASHPDHQRGADTFVSACVVSGRTAAYVLLGSPLVPKYRVYPLTPRILALFLVLAFLPLARSIVRPVEQITAAARAFGAGDLRARVGMRRMDELGTLARVFDDMATRVEELIRSERALLANVSHELRTPLSRIRVVLELASAGDDAAGVQRYLAEIAHDLAELERLVDDVLTSARLDIAAAHPGAGAPPLRFVMANPAQIVDQIALRFADRYPDRKLFVERGTLSEAGELCLDAMMVRRAIENVLDNAVKYSPADRPVFIRCGAVTAGLEVAVEDSGIGMQPADTSQLFTPFFRADSSRARSSGGVGLGLALARSIARAHGGDARVESVAGAGTTVWLTFYGRVV